MNNILCAKKSMITEDELRRSAHLLKTRLAIPAEVDDLLVSLCFIAPEFSKDYSGQRVKKVRNRPPLSTALTLKLVHQYGASDYDILEFLGDAVIHLVIREYLVFRFGHQGPGGLTRIAHPIESNRFLQCLMNNRNLCSMLFGVTLERSMAGAHPLCADSFEALAGAIYYYYAIVRADKMRALQQIEQWLFNFWDLGKYIDEVRATSTFTCGLPGQSAPVEAAPCEATTAVEKLQCLSQTLDLKWSQELVEGLYIVTIVLVTPRTNVELAVIRGPNVEDAYAIAAEIALARLADLRLI